MVSAKSGTDYIKYRWIEDVEDLEKYQPGGYHPVCIGDVLEGRYRVIHKLGYGGYSTVWLARDQQLEVYVAVKISTADSPARESEILYDLAKFDHPGRSMIPLIQDQLELRGPNGSHKCYVTSPARSNLDDAQDSDCFITETARVIAAQLIMSVAYLHARGYVHGGKLSIGMTNPLRTHVVYLGLFKAHFWWWLSRFVYRTHAACYQKILT